MSRPKIRQGNALIGIFWAIVMSVPIYAFFFWAIWG